MKMRITFLCLIMYTGLSITAQQYMQGLLLIDQKDSQQIFYDRTQVAISRNRFQTIYKVFNAQQGLLYKISLTHDRQKQQLQYSIAPAQEAEKQMQISYNAAEAGYYISDLNLLDTTFNEQTGYQFLVSFTDTIRDYPILHCLQASQRIMLKLDPVNQIVRRKHTQWILRNVQVNNTFRSKFSAHQKQLESRDEAMLKYLLHYRDSVFQIREQIMNRISEMQQKAIKENKWVLEDKKALGGDAYYKGEKKNGKANGLGCMVKNTNTYCGIFSNNTFIKGVQYITYDNVLYCGEYANFDLHGWGYWQAKDSTYQLGQFAHGKLTEGFVSLVEKDGTRYAGQIQNKQRHGFGELITRQGDNYIGLFVNGRFVYGIVKEAKRSETSVYKFEQAAKKFITDQAADMFILKLQQNRPALMLF